MDCSLIQRGVDEVEGPLSGDCELAPPRREGGDEVGFLVVVGAFGFAKEKVGRGGMPGRAGIFGRAGLFERVGG